MTASIVAKRYALALFQIAKEQKLLDKMEEELRVLKELVVNNTDLRSLLKSPKLSLDKKKEILTTAFSKANKYILNTLMILIDRHREDYIEEVVDHFIQLANNEKGVMEATVYSVRPLTKEESDAVSSVFAKKVGKKSLIIENIVDSNLLGGIKLRIGNTIYDGSLKGKLDRLERQLLS